MKNAELVVEIGVEEIPAAMLTEATDQLARNLIEGLKAQRLGSSVLAKWYTPRRMIVGLGEIPIRQDDRLETIMGPPRRVAFDADGNPTRAAIAFAEKNGVPISGISFVTTPKGEYLCVDRRQKGERTAQVLRRIIPEAISGIEFPKTMIWTADKFRFARPLRWVLALFAGRVVRFAIADVVSSRYTSGHRFTGRRRIAVAGLASLRDSLRENGVVVDPKEREEIIRAGLSRAAKNAGGQVLADENLLATVINLHENPSVICGAFEPRFLGLPEEILVTVMREHQKYFSVVDPDGRLLPAFLAVVNVPADPAGRIREGHARVLRARFADAEFFWNSDRKIRLAEREASLQNVLFQQKLGSYLDKTRRIAALVPKLAAMAGCTNEPQNLETAAHLLKCDLVTEMVKEFTDLQGVVGGLYARAEGYPETIWRAVYEQYQPKTSNSASPSTLAGALCSIADRLDTVGGCFAAGLVPSGSKDPLAVRRQGNGILKILIDHRLDASLRQLAAWSLESLGPVPEETLAALQNFFAGRLRFLFEERGYSYDCINAAMAVGCDHPVDTLERVRALQERRQEPDFQALASNFKRVVNILAQSEAPEDAPDPSLMSDAAELALWERYQQVYPEIEAARQAHEYGESLRLMASLRAVVDDFFLKVLVMAEDPVLRRNRLALLRQLARLFLTLGDISQMVIERAG